MTTAGTSIFVRTLDVAALWACASHIGFAGRQAVKLWDLALGQVSTDKLRVHVRIS